MTWSSWFNKAKQTASRVVGGIGNVVKRVGEIGGKVVRTVGDISRPVLDGVSAVSTILGQPEIALGAQALKAGIDKFAPKVSNVLDKAGRIGGNIADVGGAIGRAGT